MIKKIFVFIFLVVFFTFPEKASAQESWVIERFHADIQILENGEVEVKEEIDVDFKNVEKHGIYREIPYVYTDEGGKVYSEVDVMSVLQDDSDAKQLTSRNEGYIRIRIGDPDRTISGKHTYEIHYLVKGVLRGYEEYDEFFWNVTGNYWEVPILKASSTVTIPKPQVERVTCYLGPAGSLDVCDSTIDGEMKAHFSSPRIIQPYEGFTVVIGYSKGIVPLITVPSPKTFLDKLFTTSSILTFLIGSLLGIMAVIFMWYKTGRDFWFRGKHIYDKEANEEVKPIGGHESVVVEFTPPDKLKPAEIGVLVDERAHTHDVVATIIDLAGRGFLTITETPKKWLFGSKDYVLDKKNKDASELLDYENYLLGQLFESGDSVQLSTLKTTFYDELKMVKTKLYKEVVGKKLFSSNPESIRTRYLVGGIILIVLSVYGLITGGSSELIPVFNISGAILVSGLFIAIFSQFMPRRTAHGRELYRRARGYHMFINSAEKYRQRFFEKEHMFNEVLPYAIIFGLTEKFTQAMKDMGALKSSPTWYHGTGHFSPSHFQSNLSHFSSSVSSTIASAPRSSGFSSSGGGSGGGFGGGGGGSW